MDKILVGQALSGNIDGMNLQQELKRPVPFHSLQQETLLNLMRVGDQIDNRVSRLCRENGLTVSRFNVLRNLALADRPLTCGEIGERMIQVVPAITSLVDQLEKHGLVVRKRCQQDRRVVYIAITEEGRALSEAMMPSLKQLETQLLSWLTEDELKTLIGLLEKTRGSIAAADQVSA
ncbi:MarR family winged helix-turn-helix transcriptional regulator [Aporhodopirellula aestuarii]|uniref:MarR family transcriptional regulator n=1 Tax=Aporhodopirellula aestuarii TaxID=2950107 RepID=A0ABT0U4V3_9BACT|nr:MarR family transcriptional regulator [Aporhodopirellula aestuarii]MCM2371937.1 MarR family transcriptional regulator [Aporhodopirellula aestuarii]